MFALIALLHYVFLSGFNRLLLGVVHEHLEAERIVLIVTQAEAIVYE